MQRVNRIIFNEKYKNNVKTLRLAEQYRRFCKHDISHFLDVARIMYIKALEKNIPIKKDVIYATALLHDIGRVKEYTEKVPHHIESAEFAKQILPLCGYDEKEIDMIVSAILYHRQSGDFERNLLGTLLYYADKKSRICITCPVERECYWDSEKKNMEIII